MLWRRSVWLNAAGCTSFFLPMLNCIFCVMYSWLKCNKILFSRHLTLFMKHLLLHWLKVLHKNPDPQGSNRRKGKLQAAWGCVKWPFFLEHYAYTSNFFIKFKKRSSLVWLLLYFMWPDLELILQTLSLLHWIQNTQHRHPLRKHTHTGCMW